MNNTIEKLFSLEGKNIFITGCASGIGQAFCKAASMAGANIIGSYFHRNYKETELIVKKNGTEFYPVKVDLSKITAEKAEEIFLNIEENFGKVSVLINNAGVNLRNMALDYSEEDWEKVFNVNLKGYFLLSQAIARRCKNEKRKCKIVNVASLLGFQAGYRTVAYTSSKHGVIGLTKVLANEWGQYNINVNSIVPGYIRTSMTEDFLNNVEVSSSYLKRISIGRWGKPDDLMGAVVFLASQASDYVQGASIVVDGGYLNS